MPLANVFESVGIDILGPLPKSYQQNEYVIVLTDYGSRFVEAKAIRSANAETVAKFIMENVILRHGTPKELLSDQGVQFRSELVKALLKQLSVHQKQTTAYHPQCNGLTERFNKTICDILSHFIDENHKTWDVLLPYAVFAFNTSQQETTKETPFKLVYARDPVTPIERALEHNVEHQYAQAVRDSIDYIRSIVKDRIAASQRKSAKYYNEKHRDAQFEVGDLVLLFRPVIEVGKSNKFHHRYMGPYQILRRTSNVNYEIMDLRARKSRKPIEIVHVSRLKRFHTRTSACEGSRNEASKTKKSSTVLNRGVRGNTNNTLNREMRIDTENMSNYECCKPPANQKNSELQVTLEASCPIPKGIGETTVKHVSTDARISRITSPDKWTYREQRESSDESETSDWYATLTGSRVGRKSDESKNTTSTDNDEYLSEVEDELPSLMNDLRSRFSFKPASHSTPSFKQTPLDIADTVNVSPEANKLKSLPQQFIESDAAHEQLLSQQQIPLDSAESV
ncbi:integrase core domain protein-like protein, partial [Leptotrombidium deliense]